MALINFLAYLVILCFERRCPKQNTVARLKSKFLAPTKKYFWAGYATALALLCKQLPNVKSHHPKLCTSIFVYSEPSSRTQYFLH